MPFVASSEALLFKAVSYVHQTVTHLFKYLLNPAPMHYCVTPLTQDHSYSINARQEHKYHLYHAISRNLTQQFDEAYHRLMNAFFEILNVRSSSTLFSDNNQWNFEIPFPCARFKSLLGYNLITKSSNHQKWDVQTPISWNWKNTLSCEIYFFEKLRLANLLNSKPIKMEKKN